MTCPACQYALTDWCTGMLIAGCDGCNARDLAQSPRVIRIAEYARIAALEGVDVASALRDRVKAEAERIALLRDHLNEKKACA